MVDEFIELHLANKSYEIHDEMHIWHSLVEADVDKDMERIRRGAIIELATQWRHGEMIAGVKFRGWGFFAEMGFSTDISETCQWITPFRVKPEDPQDIQLGLM